jgi:hypothetical protein
MKLEAMNRLEARISVLHKVDRYRPNTLVSPCEYNEARSIILTYRPAFFIQNGKFPSPVPPSPDINWDNVLSPQRDKIEKTIESVGKIEFKYESGEEWEKSATGFLVAENIVMTCRHVVDDFCDYCDSTDQWTFNTGVKKPRIDYCEEIDPAKELEFKIKEIVKVYDRALDMALVKVTKTTKVSWSDKRQKHPEPLVLADTMPDLADSKELYVVGYPDKQSDEPNVDEVLGDNEDALGVKRLSPGIVRSSHYPHPQILFTDCSTTNGNSGSCVIDIESNQVIGLLYNGIYLDNWNEAIALPNLDAGIKNELKQHGIQFA